MSKASHIRWRENNPEGYRARMREQTRKKQALMTMLKDAPCQDCLCAFPRECMDFDHVRGSKAKLISHFNVYSQALVIELAKCDLVCANCHRIRTRRRFNECQTNS